MEAKKADCHDRATDEQIEGTRALNLKKETVRDPDPKVKGVKGEFRRSLDTKAMTSAESLHSGFFALRTPLLPFDAFRAWSDGLGAASTVGGENLERALAEDCELLRRRLGDWVARSEVREALFVASPDLDDALDLWVREPESERGARVERALVRYFTRMAARPTPFGLFAGSSVGEIGSQTRLVLEGRETYQRHSRLDMDYLFVLAEAVERDPVLRGGLRFLPNSSLYRAAGRWHYVEARVEGKQRTHHLVAAEDSEELASVLAKAEPRATAGDLVAGLVAEGVASQEEAREYVGELIDGQILCADLELSVTGAEPVQELARQLRKLPETEAAGARLEQVREELAAIDEGGLGADPGRYRDIARRLEGLPAPPERARLFQVDMVKPSPQARLGSDVLEEVIRGIKLLQRLTPARTSDDLSRFRDAFVARYEAREVSLVEALDDEAGIGFPPDGQTPAGGGPLLEGIALEPEPEGRIVFGLREKALLTRLTQTLSRGAAEISIDPKNLGDLAVKQPDSLPPSFAAMLTIAAVSQEALERGHFRILFHGVDGPSGARLLGRFCHADAQLRRGVEEHLRAEEALDPEAIFAEIVHLPEGRVGNVLSRPVLRQYEIPYLGRSGAPTEHQIPITDLLVSVADRRIVLRSRRLGRRVIPRLTSAHNHSWKGVPIYRFLAELQAQGSMRGMGWDWGPLGSALFLPRVVCGRLVLAPARWNVSAQEWKRLASERGAQRFRAVQSWRQERSLPRLVVLADADNRLPVDLENVLCVESFVHLVKNRPGGTLTEMFPGPDELCARGPEGRFVHELIVPFVRAAGQADASSGRATAQRKPQTTSTIHVAGGRTFLPGSEWLYAKLYTGAAAADRLLLHLVAPLVAEAFRTGAADRWFFLRYADPDRHIRLRLHGAGPKLIEQVLPALHAAAAPAVADGRIQKVQLDTYEREVERYGGPAGVELAERIFQADSESVLEILDMLEEGDVGLDERWRLALLGIDFLLDDFGFDQKRKAAMIDGVRGSFAAELDAGTSAAKAELGERFRKESRSLDLLFDPLRQQDSNLAPGFEVLRRRSQILSPWIRALSRREEAGELTQSLAAIAQSCVHMHVNRMLRSVSRAEEFVLYDFLARLYRSRVVRARSKPFEGEG